MLPRLTAFILGCIVLQSSVSVGEYYYGIILWMFMATMCERLLIR